MDKLIRYIELELAVLENTKAQRELRDQVWPDTTPTEGQFHLGYIAAENCHIGSLRGLLAVAKKLAEEGGK